MSSLARSLLLLVLLMLIALGSAKPESLVMGDYNASFDMGHSGLNWTIKDLSQDTYPALHYPSNIAFNKTDYYIGITINEYPISLQKYDSDSIGRAIKTLLQLYGFSKDLSLTEVTIDESQAVMGEGHLGTNRVGEYPGDVLYILEWYSGGADISVETTYPWENGTQKLFETIRITKNNTTSVPVQSTS